MKKTLIFAGLVFATFWSAFVTKVMWNWFCVPAFGVQTISLGVAMGLGFMVAYFRVQVNTKPPDFYDSKTWNHIVLSPAVTLFFGWLIHTFLV